ncbi:glycine zipper family protein [Algoriphagus sp. A40]|uniref:glycine zipper family protein n=1 Tax=Algoriphagus sp. A40 TaxID=1945863 RepID=UPI0020C49144|nr:glycine zipper domain-containing protein [Algoriphagus sp. A40]
MKIIKIFLFFLFGGIGHLAFAQEIPTMPDTAKISYNQISQGLDLFIYPSKGQSKSQQKKDEVECYYWATEQSGIDPLNLPKVEAAPVQSGPTGGGARGAAKGAAAGAAIGAITGDAGEGAAVGAVVGGLSGRRAGKAGQAQANQQAEANVAAQEQKMMDDFKKAFSVCIEGKGYTIK